MMLVRYQNQVAGFVGATVYYLAPHLARLPPSHVDRRRVEVVCQWALVGGRARRRRAGTAPGHAYQARHRAAGSTCSRPAKEGCRRPGRWGPPVPILAPCRAPWGRATAPPPGQGRRVARMPRCPRPASSSATRSASKRRAADRERVKQAAQELLSSDGWGRWVRARRLLHRYSAFILGAACRSCRLAVVCCR